MHDMLCKSEVTAVLQRCSTTYHVAKSGFDSCTLSYIRWIENPQEVDVNRIVGTSDMKKIKDLKGNPLLVFANSWSVNMVLERNEGLKLSEFGRN